LLIPDCTPLYVRTSSAETRTCSTDVLIMSGTASLVKVMVFALAALPSSIADWYPSSSIAVPVTV
jgi:hypothetical protein